MTKVKSAKRTERRSQRSLRNSDSKQADSLSDPLLRAVWERDREIVFLKSELEQIRREVWHSSMELLDRLGVLEIEGKHMHPDSHTELRRMISRLKGVL